MNPTLSKTPRHRAYMTQPTAIEELRARLTGIADGHGRHRDITRLHSAAPSLGEDPSLEDEVAS